MRPHAACSAACSAPLSVTVCASADIASLCEGNLKKTLKHGGRKEPPSPQELQAIIVSGGSGRYVVCTLAVVYRGFSPIG